MPLARNATASQSPTQTSCYERYQPEQTLLYQLVEQHYPAFKASLEAQGQYLPRYIQQEFEDFLQCGRLEYGFLRVRCEDCHHERNDTDWCDKSPSERHRAVTWMQRLQRVFNIDIEVCEHCGGQVKVIASIEDPKVIEQIRCAGPAQAPEAESGQGGCHQAARVTTRASATANHQPVRPITESSL